MSDISDCTQGSTSASPMPFKAAHAVACTEETFVYSAAFKCINVCSDWQWQELIERELCKPDEDFDQGWRKACKPAVGRPPMALSHGWLTCVSTPEASLSDSYRDTTCMTWAAYLCQRARERDASARGAPDDGAGSRQKHPVVYGAGRADNGGHSRLAPTAVPLRAWLAKDRCCAHTSGCPCVLWTRTGSNHSWVDGRETLHTCLADYTLIRSQEAGNTAGSGAGCWQMDSGTSSRH